MIEITFLGTGCMQPTKARNHSCIALSYNEEIIILDCGEGTQRQMRIAGLKPAKVSTILLSHWHGDHVFGLPGLLSTMGADKPDRKVTIYGPPGSKNYLDHLMQSFAKKDIIEFIVKEVKAGVIFNGEKYSLECQPLRHSVLCFGYRFQEHDRRRINVAKATKLGLKGPILGQLQLGKSVLYNNKKVSPDEVTYIVPGKTISYVADTVPCDGASALAKDVDLLISEGTHLNDIKEKTEQFMHLTVKQAALLASANNAKKLIITHLSQRYKEPSEVLEEAKTYFPNSTVAEDFMKVKL
ncbi:TPA: ribonuclease Z [Candidatus Woesearchaeota archaeon]|nr:ribonuclease Z [Candidatus Woesearchaeota archaeon]